MELGGEEMTVTNTKLKKYLLSRIDQTDLVQLEKVDRYVNFIDLINQFTQQIKEEGGTQLTENANQKFVKPHPLIAEVNKLNAQVLSIEKSFIFSEEKDDESFDLL